jgi:hypothetical protein
MRRTLLNAALLLALLILVSFVVFLVNQTVQVVALAHRLHPALGTTVLGGLLLVYAICLFVPVFMLMRLPKPLIPPATDQSPEFERHLTALSCRLRNNPLVAGQPLVSRAEIEEALRVLGARADAIIQQTGSQVFVTTAISQNGSLDGLIVLLAQSRMIWRIAHIYYQRPTLRDLAYLYGNVAATALVASQLDDLDLSEQAQPLLSAALGSIAGAIPGLHAASALLVNSILTGTANAFLTLRVGIITRRHCGALVLPDKRALRRTAVAQAAQMLGAIAQDGTKRVVSAFWTASKARAAGTARGMGDSVRQAASALAAKLRLAARESTGDPNAGRIPSDPNP